MRKVGKQKLEEEKGRKSGEEQARVRGLYPPPSLLAISCSPPVLLSRLVAFATGNSLSSLGPVLLPGDIIFYAFFLLRSTH